ncbi:MAG: hypothetical protein CMH46_18580 [Muricauda sp.]|nr:MULTISPECIES: DUF1573 domain-containing protein [unclassified Allomuricauda]MAU17538.1 hypothetical protein [Allomuricauda sp.]|tara:strand:+ start:5182 stop:5622 length:441 start_codon:yes stop_codon:yes gene_type:complete
MKFSICSFCKHFVTRLFYHTSFALFSFLIFSCNSVEIGPKASFDKTLYDFGNVKADEEVSVIFKVTNVGDKPLHIKKIKSNCGCTVPKPFQGQLEPNQSHEILVDIDPYTLGAFNSSLIVIFDDKNKIPPKTLRITGVFDYLSLLE